MRIGINPEKDNKKLEIEAYHRVVVPVYIPNLKEDYFKDGLKILKLCLESLLLTIHSKTRITIIDNNCCIEVSNYLKELYSSSVSIDQLINSKVNLGKINAIYAAVKSNLEPLITISDADVMFLPKWQSEVEKVFTHIPEAGMVSPVPSSRGYMSPFLNSTIYYAITKGKLKFSKVINPEAMIKFQESIGRKSMYNKQHLEKYLTIENSKIKAVIGCGHFVATFRSEVFKYSPKEVCKFKIVGGSETVYFDTPNDKARFLRLATTDNYAYHLGNKEEDWMKDSFKSIENSNIKNTALKKLSKAKQINKIGYFIGLVSHKILFRKFKKYYFSFKGVREEY